MRPFEFIHKMPTSQLIEYADHLQRDIKTRKRRHLEFSSLRRYLGVANLELETRRRREMTINMLDSGPANVEYAWMARKDCGVG